MKNLIGVFATLAGVTVVTPLATYGQATLTQTIDLKTWTGVPVTIVQPPPPQPSAGFSLTSIAIDPMLGIVYVADYATTNIYQINALSNTVMGADYTNGLYSTADIGPIQNPPGTAPKVVMANPVNYRWTFMGQGGGAQFSGTTASMRERFNRAAPGIPRPTTSTVPTASSSLP
jgi:hypothetical protein